MISGGIATAAKCITFMAGRAKHSLLMDGAHKPFMPIFAMLFSQRTTASAYGFFPTRRTYPMQVPIGLEFGFGLL